MKRRRFAGAVVFAIGGFAAAGPAAAQELDPTVRSKAMAATAFVKVGGYAMGSAFVFKQSETTAFLITSYRAVSRSDVVEVVFASGTPAEKRVPARVASFDAQANLACLVVKDAPDLPSPLEIGTKSAVRETENVFIAGFHVPVDVTAPPTGPEVTLTKATVSSIRRNDAGGVVAIQISGDLGQGMRGGAVVDAKGKVVGVLQGGISGSAMSFAVPAEQVRSFFIGRAGRPMFKTVVAGPAVMRVEAAAPLKDPLSTLRSVTLHWIYLKDLPRRPQREKDGTWRRMAPATRTVGFRENSAEGTVAASFDVPHPAQDGTFVGIYYQFQYTAADGSVVWDEPASTNISPTVETAKPPPPSTPKAEPKTPAAPKLEAGTLPVAEMLPLRAAIARLLPAKNEEYLYALDLSEGRLLKISLGHLAIADAVEIADDAIAMAQAPNGKTLYVLALLRSEASADFPRGARALIQVVDASALRVTSSFVVDVQPLDITAKDGGTLFVSTYSDLGDGLFVVDASKRKVVETHAFVRDKHYLQIHPDQTRLYLAHALGGEIKGMLLRRTDPSQPYTKPYPVYSGGAVRAQPPGRPLDLSGDGRYLLGAGGAILRLRAIEPTDIAVGKSKSDLQVVAQIDPFTAAAMAAGAPTCFVATADGLIREYKVEGGAVVRTWQTDRVCSHLIVDNRRHALYAIAGPRLSGPYPPNRLIYGGGPSAPRVGDLVMYSLAGQGR